jgi:hypothetical protein
VTENQRPPPKMRSLASDAPLLAHPSGSHAGPSMLPTISSNPSHSPQSTSDELPTPESTQTRVTSRKRIRVENRSAGPVQEQDAGVSLMDGLRPEEHNTLPPAYDSSWRM